MQKLWWHDKNAYQIYPKSFYDSNGDGIGDLPGILQKLDYLRDLGIDILWLSPVYQSPMADQGYDVSDYYAIDPVFGTMEDMDALLREAGKRNMYVLMDMVVNHCSSSHIWFQKACQDPAGKYGDYFYIRDLGKDGSLPGNCRSYFGGSAWAPLPGHPDKVYLHTFLPQQPDLNWGNPELRQEMYRMMNWWLQKGVAGFRMDAIDCICKRLPFRSFPPDREDGTCGEWNLSETGEGLSNLLNEMADATYRKYGAFTVGEMPPQDSRNLPLFIGSRGVFSAVFDFRAFRLGEDPRGWYARKPVTPDQFRDAWFDSQAQNAGTYANILENHDLPRCSGTLIPAGNETAKKMLGGLSYLLRGIPFLYQGQEIGMENHPCTDPDRIQDPNARDQYAVALQAGLSGQQALEAAGRYSRDNGRTPFQWTGGRNAGFTSGTPWMAVNPDYEKINLQEQQSREDSLWQFYRRLLKLRKDPVYGEILVYGSFAPYLPRQQGLTAYFRRGPRTLLVLGNFLERPQSVPLPGRLRKVILSNLPEIHAGNGEIRLEPWQLLVLDLDQTPGKEA